MAGLEILQYLLSPEG